MSLYVRDIARDITMANALLSEMTADQSCIGGCRPCMQAYRHAYHIACNTHTRSDANKRPVTLFMASMLSPLQPSTTDACKCSPMEAYHQCLVGLHLFIPSLCCSIALALSSSLAHHFVTAVVSDGSMQPTMRSTLAPAIGS
jgi:hypothetical protein